MSRVDAADSMTSLTQRSRHKCAGKGLSVLRKAGVLRRIPGSGSAWPLSMILACDLVAVQATSLHCGLGADMRSARIRSCVPATRRAAYECRLQLRSRPACPCRRLEAQACSCVWLPRLARNMRATGIADALGQMTALPYNVGRSACLARNYRARTFSERGESEYFVVEDLAHGASPSDATCGKQTATSFAAGASLHFMRHAKHAVAPFSGALRLCGCSEGSKCAAIGEALRRTPSPRRCRSHEAEWVQAAASRTIGTRLNQHKPARQLHVHKVHPSRAYRSKGRDQRRAMRAILESANGLTRSRRRTPCAELLVACGEL